MTDALHDEQALAERVVHAMMAKDEFSQLLGIEIVDVHPRAAVVRMTVRPDMVNGFGVCHGGVAFSLADSAFAFACNTHGNITVSIQNTITYPKKISVGDVLVASAREESASSRLSYYHVEVRRGDELVNVFRGTAYRTEKPFFPDTE
jgi:acyl-CoA thioesterase